MRRSIALVMALMVLFCAQAAFAQEADAGFVFRSGITWASTFDDVMAAEAGNSPTQSDPGLSYITDIIQLKASVAERDADLVYFFADGKLAMTSYDFMRRREPGDFSHLYDALVSKYGQPQTRDAQPFLDLLNKISEMSYTLEAMKEYAGWLLEDGTRISISYYDEDSFVILYENTALLERLLGASPTPAPTVNTDGL